MNTKTVKMTLVLLIAATTAAWAEDEDVPRFKGGSYDGWARSAMAEPVSLEPPPPPGSVLIVR